MEDKDISNFKKNKKSKKKNKENENKKIMYNSHKNKVSINKVPQIINNYDVKVNITKEKSNNININNMNINSLYSQSDSLNNFYNMDSKSSIFKNIKLNNYLNKTEHFFSTEQSPKKNNLQFDKYNDKYMNNYNKKTNYEKMISTLKDEFKNIENLHNKGYLSKTLNMKNDLNFNSNNFIKDINIKLIKKNNENDDIYFNKRNKNKKNSLEDIILSTDITLFQKINNKKMRNKTNSIGKVKSTKCSFDLQNISLFTNKNNKIYKYNNFNDIYDSLINGKDLSYKTKNKNGKRNNLNTTFNKQRDNQSFSSTNNKSYKKERNIYNQIDTDSFTKKNKNYYKCNLFNNLNKLTFENPISNKMKIYKKYLNTNKYKIYKNISFTYNKSIKNINIINKKTGKSLNILNEIINIQKNIIFQYKIKEKILQKEIMLKMKEINEFKNACLKLMYYIKKEKNDELNFYNKSIILQTQLIQENNILKDIILSNKLFLFKQKENNIKSFFEKQKKIKIDKEKHKINNKKRNNSNEKKDLINKMLNKEKKSDSPLSILRNNSYEYLLKISPYLDKKNKNKSILNNYKILNYKKKLCYLHKSNK